MTTFRAPGRKHSQITSNLVKMADGANQQSLEAEVMMLLQSRRYDPEILPKLEEFVDWQVAHKFCDQGANLAILKLYQFYPTFYNASVVSKILIKMLTLLPTSDFLCALYLIPESKTVNEPIPVIMRMQELLETGKFQLFWEESGSCAELLASVPGAIDSIRAFMVSVISRTYKSIHVSTLTALLNVKTSELQATCDDQGWTLAGDVVEIPGNDENQPRPRCVEESLSFRQVAAKLL